MKHQNMIAKNQRNQSKNERLREKALHAQKLEKTFPEETAPNFAHTLAQEFNTPSVSDQFGEFDYPMTPNAIPNKPRTRAPKRKASSHKPAVKTAARSAKKKAGAKKDVAKSAASKKKPNAKKMMTRSKSKVGARKAKTTRRVAKRKATKRAA